MFHIVHDAIHDQYKVICIILSCVVEDHESQHWVLLLDGPNRCWRKISSQCPTHRPLPHGLSQKVTINGHMYYRAYFPLVHKRMLVSFDITSEEIITIEESDEDGGFGHPYVGIIEHGGKVASLHHLHEGVIVLRILEDAEKNKWSKKTFELRPSQMHMVQNVELWVRGTTKNGEVIFVSQNKFYSPRRRSFFLEPQSTSFFYFYRYNLQNNLFTKVEIKDTSNLYRTNMWDIIGFDDIENLTYF